jgi:hypothetical protein
MTENSRLNEKSRLNRQRESFKSLLVDLKNSVTPEQFQQIVRVIDLAIDALSDRADAILNEWERLADIIESVETEK